VLTKT